MRSKALCLFVLYALRNKLNEKKKSIKQLEINGCKLSAIDKLQSLKPEAAVKLVKLDPTL